MIIGPGRIGCGFLAPLFADAGWEVVLAARAALRSARIGGADFTVRIAGDGHERAMTARAVSIGGREFVEVVCDANAIATAVGVRNVRDLAGPLARALAARGLDAPIDVWTLENADVASSLELAVRRAADATGLQLPAVGFAGAITGVVVSRGDWRSSGRPRFVGDSVRWMLVDETRLRRPLPELPGVSATRRYGEQLLAKTVGFGAGHALCAYLGALRGHRYIHDAVRDPAVGRVVRRALLASRRAGAVGGGDTVDVTLERYANPHLVDPIERVARDPIRKLSPGGPLIAPARLIEGSTGRPSPEFASGIAGALLYRHPRDRESKQLAELLACHDVRRVVAHVCDVAPDGPLADEIVRHYSRMSGRPVAPTRHRRPTGGAGLRR